VDMDLASAAEHATVVIFSLDAQGVVTYVNPAAKHLFGYEPREVVGQPCEVFVHPSQRAKALEGFQRLASGEPLRGQQLTILHHDGHPVHMQFDATPRLDASGRFLGAHGVSRVVTSRGRARPLRGSLLDQLTSLREIGETLDSKAEAAAALEAIARFPARLGADAGWVDLVEREAPLRLRTAAHWGLEDDLLRSIAASRGGTLDGLDPAATAIRTRAMVVLDLAGPEADAVPWLLEARGLGYRSVAVVAMVYRDRVLGALHACSRQAGLFDAWRSFLLELFAHGAASTAANALALERARQSEAFFGAIAEHLPCVVYVGSPGWPPTILFVSSNIAQFVDVTPEEIYADPMKLFSFVHPSDRERVIETVRGAMSRPEPYTVEHRVVRGDAKTAYYALTRSVPVLGAGGEVLFRYGIIMDVTEQMRLERELLQSQRLAVIGEMAAMMAHEIRNPLAGMSLALRALRGPGCTPELEAECLDDLDHCLRRINDTVSRALDFARVRPMNPRPCRLADILASVRRLSETYLRKSSVELDLDLPEDLPGLVADPDELEHVFVNLFLNACKAMPDGGRLTVRARAEPGHLAVEVSDTGIGIGPTQIGEIFNPFHSGFTEGVGLGLPLCQRIIAAHGGTIRVESAPGQGSTFHIELPLEPADAPDPGR